jgi:hypothetical protein
VDAKASPFFSGTGAPHQLDAADWALIAGDAIIRDQRALHEVHPEAEFETEPASGMTKFGPFMQTNRPASGTVADRPSHLVASGLDRSTWMEFFCCKAVGEQGRTRRGCSRPPGDAFQPGERRVRALVRRRDTGRVRRWRAALHRMTQDREGRIRSGVPKTSK